MYQPLNRIEPPDSEMRASDTHLMAPRTSHPLFAGRFSLLERLSGQEATYGEA